MLKISWDRFFYYSQNPLREEIEYDLRQGLFQPLRTLWYNRQDGAGIHESINLPNGLTLLINLRYNIVRWVAFRNTRVTDGNNNTKDRRIAVSQEFIDVQQKGQELNVDVLYIPFFDFRKPENLNIAVGV